MPALAQNDSLRRVWVGLDILPFAKSIYGSKDNTVEIFGSYNIGKKRYAAAEGGFLGEIRRFQFQLHFRGMVCQGWH